MEECRKDERVSLGVPVKVAVEDGIDLDAILSDYSPTEVGLVLTHSMRRGAKVKIIIGEDGHYGEVVRCRRLDGNLGYSIGIELDSEDGKTSP